MMAMLDIRDLVGGYGSVQIFDCASLKVDRRIIGACPGKEMKDEEVRAYMRSA
jgi:hypothetical protein